MADMAAMAAMADLTVYNIPPSPPIGIGARGLSLSFPAIALLHVYWILGQITYPIDATVPMVLAYDIQYFAMGV
ncbi:hypothetical protein SI65_00983 [Aspergillus cristatus]|uniref:Uncharacterized protein n=1 Tax=Aspergillus cristatus TaxID=573508 RepID=A0A1E3BQY2_ASPCR|nr:hypothetical protein SI65_00983 [Aspergillus cristatus]